MKEFLEDGHEERTTLLSVTARRQEEIEAERDQIYDELRDHVRPAPPAGEHDEDATDPYQTRQAPI